MEGIEEWILTGGLFNFIELSCKVKSREFMIPALICSLHNYIIL